jgi:hypothetical protein
VTSGGKGGASCAKAHFGLARRVAWASAMLQLKRATCATPIDKDHHCEILNMAVTTRKRKREPEYYEFEDGDCLDTEPLVEASSEYFGPNSKHLVEY